MRASKGVRRTHAGSPRQSAASTYALGHYRASQCPSRRFATSQAALINCADGLWRASCLLRKAEGFNYGACDRYACELMHISAAKD